MMHTPTQFDMKIENDVVYQRSLTPEEFESVMDYHIELHNGSARNNILTFSDLFFSPKTADILRKKYNIPFAGTDFLYRQKDDFYFHHRPLEEVKKMQTFFTCLYLKNKQHGFFAFSTYRNRTSPVIAFDLADINDVVLPVANDCCSNEDTVRRYKTYLNQEDGYKRQSSHVGNSPLLVTIVYDDSSVLDMPYLGWIVSKEKKWFRICSLQDMFAPHNQPAFAYRSLNKRMHLSKEDSFKLFYFLEKNVPIVPFDRKNYSHFPILHEVMAFRKFNEYDLEKFMDRYPYNRNNYFLIQNNLSDKFYNDHFLDAYEKETDKSFFLSVVSREIKVPISFIEDHLPMFIDYKKHFAKNANYSGKEKKIIKQLIELNQSII